MIQPYKYVKRFSLISLLFLLTMFSGFLMAAEYNWNTTFRYRFKSDNTDENIHRIKTFLSEMRTRLSLNILGKTTSAHFTLQDSRIFGNTNNFSGITGLTTGPAFHQIYFLFKYRRQLFRVGRFELPFGRERILSKNNWNNSGRSFEGIHMRRKNRFFESHLFLLPTVESSYGISDNNFDERLYGMYFDILAKYRRIFNSMELYHLNYQTINNNKKHNLYTSGSRSDINITDLLSLETEFAFQFSKYVSGQMFCLSLKLEPVKNKIVKNVFIGMDFISGNDTSDTIQNGFAKTFGARHKYHGYYDFRDHKKFLTNSHDGLFDVNFKTNLRFFSNSNLLVAYHYFNNPTKSKQYGQELDLLLKKKLSDELSISTGFSLYFPSSDNRAKQFFYLMLTAHL